MKRIIEKTRYFTLIGVAGLLIGGIAAFGWGLYRTGRLVYGMVAGNDDAIVVVELIHIVDEFLVATTVLILAVSLYELFIAEVNVPECLAVSNLQSLKAKLSSMIVLVMAVKFLESLFLEQSSLDVLRTGIAVAVVTAGLIAFGLLGKKD